MTRTSLEKRDPESDLRLAQRCLAGDPTAQRELFRAYKRSAHATLYRILGSNAPMDDLLQDTFLNVYRSLRTYRGEALLSTWVDRCTVRVAYAYISQRKARPAPLELVPELPSGDANAEERALAREVARHLYAALDKMDPKLRLAFTLHAIDGRPLTEVALLMGATLVATKTRAWRARRELEARGRKDPVLASFIHDSGARREPEGGEVA